MAQLLQLSIHNPASSWHRSHLFPVAWLRSCHFLLKALPWLPTRNNIKPLQRSPELWRADSSFETLPELLWGLVWGWAPVPVLTSPLPVASLFPQSSVSWSPPQGDPAWPVAPHSLPPSAVAACGSFAGLSICHTQSPHVSCVFSLCPRKFPEAWPALSATCGARCMCRHLPASLLTGPHGCAASGRKYPVRPIL